MSNFTRRLFILSVLALLLSGCVPASSEGPALASRSDIDGLAARIAALGGNVDPVEAARAAQVAYEYTRELAIAYEIIDPPLVHNRKVNRGERPRGLCWHWAEDMEARLKRENFRSLDLHRAIANGNSAILLAHSTAIISLKGADMRSGIVLDPWRFGGRLHWRAVTKDSRYVWRPREDVLAEKRGRLLVGQPSNDL